MTLWQSETSLDMIFGRAFGLLVVGSVCGYTYRGDGGALLSAANDRRCEQKLIC